MRNNTNGAINFLKADVAFVPKDKLKLREWMLDTTELQRCEIEHIDFIFCSDSYLLNINQQFLQHDTFTDIITFDYSIAGEGNRLKTIAGEIYISIERVKENAHLFTTSFIDELHRVMIHGVLHLCGFKDKKNSEKATMRNQEDIALNRLKKILNK